MQNLILRNSNLINLLAYMLQVSFQILLCNARTATVWAGQGDFFVAFLQMLLGFCVFELFRASLALENCSV